MQSIIHLIRDIPKRLSIHLKQKTSSQSHQARITNSKRNLDVPYERLPLIINQLHQQLKSPYQARPLSRDEKNLVSKIQSLTEIRNQNNLTRTEAYRRFYFSHPEIHWAFLAHMVSRNGGWHMTDLKGEYLPYLLKDELRNHYFLFLETMNGLIFHDAYPQLLLYQESIKRKQNLFYLLPSFHISSFMKPFWDYFWETGDSILLTISLIINEQNYIEKPVIQNPDFQEKVLQTFSFISQGALQLNQVLFPILSRYHYSNLNSRNLLVGLVIEDFTNLDERIAFGKQLYALLFGYEKVYRGAVHFARKHIHTGSRHDYWPHLYSPFKERLIKHPPQERLYGCKMREGARPIYSPILTEVWNNHPLESSIHADWFTSDEPLKHLYNLKKPTTFEMTKEHCSWLNRLEMMTIILEAIKNYKNASGSTSKCASCKTFAK